MAAKTKDPKAPKVGDPVLWYGYRLTVDEIIEGEKSTVVKCDDETTRAARADARKKLATIRAKQAKCEARSDEWLDCAKQIQALGPEAGAAVVRVGLRADLLKWWAEKGVWVSDGRILTEAQREAFKSVMGMKKVRPEQERGALLFLESQDHPSVREV